MKTKPKPPVKLPKARVLTPIGWFGLAGLPSKQQAAVFQKPTATMQTAPGVGAIAVLPCRTRREAREIVRLHRREFALPVDAAVSAVLRASAANWREDMTLRSIITIALKTILRP